VLRAALDVFEHEPEINPKLKENVNVVSLKVMRPRPKPTPVHHAPRRRRHGGHLDKRRQREHPERNQLSQDGQTDNTGERPEAVELVCKGSRIYKCMETGYF